MRKIELEGFIHKDKLEETEISIDDWFRLYIGEEGNIELRLNSSDGMRTEVSFNENCDLTSIVRDQE